MLCVGFVPLRSVAVPKRHKVAVVLKHGGSLFQEQSVADDTEPITMGRQYTSEELVSGLMGSLAVDAVL